MRALFLLLLVGPSVFAALTRLEVREVSAVLNDGRYERVTATAHFAVDPKNSANRIIADVDRAPRNKAGLVEFSADVYLLRPKNPDQSNGTLLLEVPNRGGKGMLGMFNFATGSRDPRSAEEFGDLYLLEQGYTLLWVGWQFDVPETAGTLRLRAPMAGPDVTGLVRSDFVLDRAARSVSLGDMGHLAYPTVDLHDAKAVMTVRDRVEGTRTQVPRAQWQFAREEDGRPVADPTAVYLQGGFQPGRIYEVVYTAKDPPLAGLGLAAVRDAVVYFRHSSPGIQRTLGFGTSQSGRFLRHFLYQGFNADEQGRQVFDGVWAHVAGAGRGGFNTRFAQASRDARPFLNFFHPVDLYPFTDENDGLLARAEATHVVPRIFYTNGSYEYWGRVAALIHTTADGQQDAPLAPNTRIYFNAGAQHGSGSLPPRRNGTRNLADPEDYRYQMRALLADMQAWLKDGTAPPLSRYPRLSAGQLAKPENLKFPKLPGVTPPAYPHKAYRADYGPDFANSGLISIEPPKIGAPYPVLVPQVDTDGNEIAGIRLPELQVPLGTYTGWNFRVEAQGAPDEMASFIGSYFPFARTRVERERAHDPRPSIEERYPDRAAYLTRYQAAINRLLNERLLLDRDVPKLLDRASRLWEFAQAGTAH